MSPRPFPAPSAFAPPGHQEMRDHRLPRAEAARAQAIAPTTRLREWEDAADQGEAAQKVRWHLRPDLQAPPAEFMILRSGAEQLPYFEGRPWCERRALRTGDYTLRGWHVAGTPEQPAGVVLERKSLPDLYGSLGGGRERLEREYSRMLGFARRAILIEGNYADVLDPERRDHPCRLLEGVRDRLQAVRSPDAAVLQQVLAELGGGRGEQEWRSQVRPQSIEGTLLSWGHRFGVEVLYAGSRRLAERLAFRWLATWWLEIQEEL